MKNTDKIKLVAITTLITINASLITGICVAHNYQRKIDKLESKCRNEHEEITFVYPANVTPKGE